MADMSSLVCFGRKCPNDLSRLITGLSGASFNRTQSRFNNRPVDDQVEGFLRSERIRGYVRHETFHSLHELFNKLNGYTTHFGSISDDTSLSWSRRDQRYRRIFKWYLFSGAASGQSRCGDRVLCHGVQFLKYFKAWYQDRERESVAKSSRTLIWQNRR